MHVWVEDVGACEKPQRGAVLSPIDFLSRCVVLQQTSISNMNYVFAR